MHCMRGAVPASRVEWTYVVLQIHFELSQPVAVLSKMPMPSTCCPVRLPVESIKRSLAPLAARALRESEYSPQVAELGSRSTALTGSPKEEPKASTHVLEEPDLSPCSANMLCRLRQAAEKTPRVPALSEAQHMVRVLETPRKCICPRSRP